MAASRVLVAAQTLPGSYPDLPPTPGSLALGFQDADPSLKNYALLVPGKTVLLAMNTDSSAHTVTVLSVPDDQNRKGDISAYSLAAIDGTTPVVVPLGVFASKGWLTPTDGTTPAGLWFEASSATVKFAVLTLP